MWILLLLIISGLVLLKQGADWFIKGSSGLARMFNVSELTIGLTIVAIGTSSPELFVNSFASFKGNYDIVMGNIIGSNIFNLFIILSIVGIVRPLKVQSSTAWREIPFSLLALLILFILVNDSLVFRKEASQLGRVDALIMLAFFLLFLYYAFRQLKNDKAITVKREQESIISSKKIVLLLIAGMAGLISGGKLVLDNSVKLAIELGLSEKIIGLTIVAAGTSLPELATSLFAIIKKNNDLAVGNIIGSNIFNILFILPVSSIIRPLQFNPAFNLDISFIAFGTLVLFIAMYTGKRKQIDRWEVFVLLICYALYMIYMLK